MQLTVPRIHDIHPALYVRVRERSRYVVWVPVQPRQKERGEEVAAPGHVAIEFLYCGDEIVRWDARVYKLTCHT